MAESPRLRRLRADRRALEQLKAESSVFDFVARGEMPESYTLLFHGQGVWRAEIGAPVTISQRHEVHLRLGASYPRMMPELTWRSPIFHPNISASGVVCLGGYGTYWVPSLTLDELCVMLWDMIRFANYDPNSPYNRDAALWAKKQTEFSFPLDPRPIRDRVARPGRSMDKPSTVTVRLDSAAAPRVATTASALPPHLAPPRPSAPALPSAAAVASVIPLPEIVFVDEVSPPPVSPTAFVPATGEEIVFID